MERSEPTPVLPILSTNHAQLAAHVTLRRNKMMLSKYYNLKALGGSSTKLPPRDAIIAHAIYTQKALGGSSTKLPPRDAIIAHAIYTQKALGGSSTAPAEFKEFVPFRDVEMRIGRFGDD